MKTLVRPASQTLISISKAKNAFFANQQSTTAPAVWWRSKLYIANIVWQTFSWTPLLNAKSFPHYALASIVEGINVCPVTKASSSIAKLSSASLAKFLIAKAALPHKHAQNVSLNISLTAIQSSVESAPREVSIVLVRITALLATLNGSFKGKIK